MVNTKAPTARTTKKLIEHKSNRKHYNTTMGQSKASKLNTFFIFVQNVSGEEEEKEEGKKSIEDETEVDEPIRSIKNHLNDPRPTRLRRHISSKSVIQF